MLCKGFSSLGLFSGRGNGQGIPAVRGVNRIKSSSSPSEDESLDVLSSVLGTGLFSPDATAAVDDGMLLPVMRRLEDPVEDDKEEVRG